MTKWARLFLIALAFNLILARMAPLELSIIPKINCNDINKNGLPEFIAVNSSELPRTIYYIEFDNQKIDILWEYSLNEKKQGYFSDMIVGDFDNDGIRELISVAYQDEDRDLFYVFTLNNNKPLPNIINIENSSIKIINPQKLYPMETDLSGKKLFLLTQGSPDRLIIMCEYIDGKIYNVGSIGDTFIRKFSGPIKIAIGNFDIDGIKDIFILINGRKPRGYFIYSDGSKKEITLNNFPRIRLLHETGKDINFDGIDDLIMINSKDQIMSNIWNNESISLLENKIDKMLLKLDNGLIYLYCISQLGEIGYYTIDPLTKSILTSENNSIDFSNKPHRIHSLFTKNQILLMSTGDSPQFWSTPLSLEIMSEIPPPDQYQKIYTHIPDYIININDNFTYNIPIEKERQFLQFNGKYLPAGMEFNLENIALEWTPSKYQLGFHELSYVLELREKSGLKMKNENGKKTVIQNENIIEINNAHLVYVNDPVSFSIHEKNKTIVNTMPHEWIIPIDDYNIDAHLIVQKIQGPSNAVIQLLPPQIILIPNDTALVSNSSEIINIPNTTILKDTLISELGIISDTTTLDLVINIDDEGISDTTTANFQGIEERRSNYTFAEEKLESETDPLKKKKLETSVEEFKSQEQEYQEKLKTHIKILQDGKNVWIPKDSLNTMQDSLNIANDTNNIIDTLSTTDVKNINDADIDSLIAINQSISDSIQYEAVTIDTTLDKVQLIERAIQDSNFQEVAYSELIKQQARFYWTPDTLPNDYKFLFTVSDGYSTDTLHILFTVHPEINLKNNKIIFTSTVNKPFNTTLTIEQSPPSSNYTYELQNAPENMRITNSGSINWIPLATQVDDYTFEVIVSDGIASSKLKYNIYVNAPPVISSRPPEQYFINKGELFLFPLENFDLNINAKLKWKLLNGPRNMNLTSQGVLQWEGNTLDHHPYEIQLSDGIDSVRWKGSIYVNVPPTIISKAVTLIKKTESYIYPLSAKDENILSPINPDVNNKVQFILGQGPKGMEIDGKNVLRWETMDKFPGEYEISIIASDGVDEAIQNFQLLVNSFPVITSQDSIVVKIGDTLNFQIEAYDLNSDDTLSYFMDSMRPGMELDNINGILTWIPLDIDLGNHIFNLQVRDGHGTIGTNKELEIFVYKLPQFTGDLSTEAFTGLEYSAFMTAVDMYGEKLKTSESVIIKSSTFQYYNLSDYAHHFRWTPREVDIGSHEIIVKLTDKYGFSTLYKHQINVFMNPCVQCDNNLDTNPYDNLND